MLVGYLREWYRGLFSSIKYHFVLVHPEREALRLIGEAVSHGSIRVNVQAVIPLDQAASAHDLQEDPQSSGKVVLSVDPAAVLQEQHLRPEGYYVRPT
jgi:NADPH:quinone reductase-like Zn-dependent oxidoreductase